MCRFYNYIQATASTTFNIHHAFTHCPMVAVFKHSFNTPPSFYLILIYIFGSWSKCRWWGSLWHGVNLLINTQREGEKGSGVGKRGEEFPLEWCMKRFWSPQYIGHTPATANCTPPRWENIHLPSQTDTQFIPTFICHVPNQLPA